MNNITTPHGFNDLSPQEKQSHREKIGLRAQAILNQFWRDDDTPDAVQAMEIEGWMDVLENCSHSEIRMAWARYQKDGMRTERGRLYKPDAGALYRIILNSRPLPQIVRRPVFFGPWLPDEPRVLPTAERRAEIMREVYGQDEFIPFHPKRFGSESDA